MKKYIIIILDIVIAGYLVFAVTSFNNPNQEVHTCSKVDIKIADESTYGFLDADEIKTILEKKGIYPLNKDLSTVSPRQIEDVLKVSSFVRTAECCKTTDGHVLISITQRSPLVRIKSTTGEDYYIDENGGIMPNSKYTSDLIIVTGDVTKGFAQRYLSILANVIMNSDLWRNQIEQINVQHDLGIELVPRVGNQIIFMGYMPMSNSQKQRNIEVTDFVTTKLDRLEKFYRYGISDAGWNKYSRIDIQFDNQIICKKRPQYVTSKSLDTKPVQVVQPTQPTTPDASGNTGNPNNISNPGTYSTTNNSGNASSTTNKPIATGNPNKPSTSTNSKPSKPSAHSKPSTTSKPSTISKPSTPATTSKKKV